MTALFSDFKIGLSGTLVENTIVNLWVLMDVVAEGLIKKSLKDFIVEYWGPRRPPNPSQVTAAPQGASRGRRRATTSHPSKNEGRGFQRGGPDGNPMPKKKVYPAEDHSRDMPAEQADLYTYQANLVSAGKIPKIQALGAFRRISLSPREAEMA